MTPAELQSTINESIAKRTSLIYPPKEAVNNKLETPDSAFQGLDKLGFGYTPRTLDWHGLNIKYIDESVLYDAATGKTVETAKGRDVKEEVFLCLHGQPMWSFLYRKMIPVLLHANVGQPTYNVDHANAPPSTLVRNRVICPDLVGFGRSSKPTSDAVYTYDFHIKSLAHFVVEMGLYKQREEGLTRRVTMVVQDWGGILGLLIPALFSKQHSPFTRLIVMNTILPIGRAAGKGFESWRAFAGGKDYDIGKMIKRGHPHVTQAEQDAYNMPWPGTEYKAGVRKFPLLVPLSPDNPADAYGMFAQSFYQDVFWTYPDARIFMCIGLKDPVFGTPSVTQTLLEDLGGASRMTVLEHPHAGHFVQEFGGYVAQQALHAFALSPKPPTPASRSKL